MKSSSESKIYQFNSKIQTRILLTIYSAKNFIKTNISKLVYKIKIFKNERNAPLFVQILLK